MNKSRANYFWKGVGTLVKTLGWIVTIALLTPIVYFAWRAGQPMSMPEYDGRTYYELLAERRQAYGELAQEYQASHPDVDVKNNACFSTEIFVELMEIPISARYALSAIFPTTQATIDPRDKNDGYIPTNVNWLNLLPSMWRVFEKFVWGTIEHAPDGLVPYCRIPAP